MTGLAGGLEDLDALGGGEGRAFAGGTLKQCAVTAALGQERKQARVGFGSGREVRIEGGDGGGVNARKDMVMLHV